MIHHKAEESNKGVDALSRRYLLLLVLEYKVLGFEVLRECMPMIKTSEGYLKRAHNMVMVCFI